MIFLKGFKKELTNKNPSEREDVVGDINIEFSGDDFGGLNHQRP